jgi:hypothetical protein
MTPAENLVAGVSDDATTTGGTAGAPDNRAHGPETGDEALSWTQPSLIEAHS